MTERIETREVLAGAYYGPTRWKGRMLSHACVVGSDGRVVRSLCGRVMRQNFADSGAADKTAPPTCERCLRALRNLDKPA